MSIRELSRLYDVGPPTVAKALRQLVREGVLVTRQGIGTFIAHRPDNRTGLRGVGLIVSSGMAVHYDYVYAKIMAGIYDVLSDASLIIQHLNSGNREESLAKEIRLLELDGLIWINPGRAFRSSIEILERSGVRLIGVELVEAGAASRSVSADLFAEGYRVGEYLWELGHRQVVRSISGIDPASEKTVKLLEGFDAAWRERGLAPDNRLVLSANDFSARLETLIDLKVPFTAVAVTSQRYRAALEVLTRKGLRVPEDVSIITEDDHFTAGLTDPVPTRVTRPLRELGETAAREMVAMIGGGRSGPFHTPLGWRILPGETCAKAKRQSCPIAGKKRSVKS